MLRQYFELVKPERTFANILTATAGFFLASRGFVQWSLFAATLVGTSLIIASACAANNYMDRGIDKKMARTKSRSLVKGSIPLSHALFITVLLGVSGFLVLALYVNWLVVALGAIAYVDYVVLYGIAKRYSIYGTLVGSVAGALSIVAGYTAVTGTIDAGAVILFLILATWQMPHFYAIAIYRYDDYEAAGIPVWPVKKGVHSTKVQIVIYVVAFVIATLLLSSFGYVGWVYTAGALALGILWLWHNIRGFATANHTAWARQMFSTSLLVLTILSLLIAVGPLLP